MRISTNRTAPGQTCASAHAAFAPEPPNPRILESLHRVPHNPDANVSGQEKNTCMCFFIAKKDASFKENLYFCPKFIIKYD